MTTPTPPYSTPKSGKSVERPLLDEEQVAANAAKSAGNVSAILRRVPGAGGPDCLMLDNYSWWKGMTVLDFLRDVGTEHGVGHARKCV